MRDTMTHRGPDDAGIYISPDGRVGLGHRRLSIVDLSPAGRQPMSNEDGTVWITFNGEIYNHAVLRAEVEKKGHTYRSRTDTETLVHLYEEEGPGFVRRLEGMFAIGLWDARKGELLLVRDRVGIKPLYYAVLPGTVLFGSEIKAILTHQRVSRRIDLAAFYHYLTFIAAPAPRTLFQGIHKIPPATCVTIDREGGIRSETFWDPLEVPPEQGAPYEDGEFAAARIRDLLDFMPELIFHQDEPIADWVCVPLHYVARLARRTGTIVVQVGEGSDEQFFGYEHYMRSYRNHARYFRPLMRLPRNVRGAIYDAARGLAFLLRRGGGRLDLLRSAAREETFFWGGAIAWREAEKRRLLSLDARLRIDGLNSHDVVLEIDRQAARLVQDDDFGRRMIYLELHNRLAELLLMRVDKITMASSVEARVPFLDHALVEFTMRLPTDLKIRGGQTKYLLKKAMTGILPDEIIHRPKQGFGAPVKEWLRGELYGEAFSAVMHSRMRQENLLDYDHVERLFLAHRASARDHSWHLWTLYNLSRWYDHWIAREAA